MPIVQDDDDVVAPAPPSQPIQQIAVPDYKGVTVDTKVERVENLLTHVEGSEWVVQYYSQVLNTDSATGGLNQTTSGVFQQYTRINEMELKVSSPLTTSQDPQSKQMVVRGAATIYPFLIPNTGDVFLADLGGGQEGIFQITSSERRAVFKQTVHLIEYQLIDTTPGNRLADLNQKTVKTLWYDRDFHQHGQNPLLFEEEYQNKNYLRRNYKEMVDRYYRAFFSREFKTMLMPGQNPVVYDPFLVHACNSFFDTWDTAEAQHVREYNRDEDDALRSMQVWSMIQQRDIKLLRDCFVEYGTVAATTFSKQPLLYSIYHSGIGSVIYPVDPLLTVDYIQIKNPKLVDMSGLAPPPQEMKPSIINLLPTATKRLADMFPNAVMNGFNAVDSLGNELDYPEPPPLIHKAMADGCYVLSRAFYANDTTAGAQSQLELQLRLYLSGQPLNVLHLKNLVDNMVEWNAMDRFYFTPILLVLIKAAIRGI